jgi:hypothetical protein
VKQPQVKFSDFFNFIQISYQGLNLFVGFEHVRVREKFISSVHTRKEIVYTLKKPLDSPEKCEEMNEMNLKKLKTCVFYYL